MKNKENEKVAFKEEIVAKDNKIEQLQKELLQTRNDNDELERDLNIAECKIEGVYQKKMAEEEKVKSLSTQLSKRDKEIKSLTTAKCILSCKIQGMDKRLDEYREEVKVAEQERLHLEKQIDALKVDLKKNSDHYQEIDKENIHLQDLNVVLEQKVTEYKKCDELMHEMISAVIDNGHKKCFRFRKQSKNMILINELKHLFENKISSS